jgi:aryl-phospho-beta-D-glucosidase BglC (GH1 family)
MLKGKKLLSAILSLAILMGVFVVAPVSTNAATGTPIGAADFLKTSGQVIKNNSGTGSVVQLKGTNLGGYLLQEDWMSPLGATDEWTARTTLINRFGVDTTDSLYSSYEDNWIQSTDFDNIKNSGFNMVRLPIYWENVMNRDGSMKANPWTKIDWVVNQCSSRGIYVLLDLHGVPGGDDGWQSGGRSDNQLWTNSTYQTWTVNLWQAMAAHYKGNPAVCGYDLLNEPVSNNSNLTNSMFYNTLYQAVRSVDPDHLIVVEAFYDFNYIVPPSTYGWTNVVYETHNYDMNDSSDGAKQLSFAYSQLQMLSQYKSAWNVPIYAGEYCFYGFDNVWDVWLQGLNSMGISWSNWAYKVKQNYGNWGFFNTDTNPSPDLNNDDTSTILAKWSKFTTGNFAANISFQNLIKRYTGSTTPDTAGTYYIRAAANSDIVSVDNTGTNPLTASKTAVGGAWESYKVINNSDGTISLQAMSNNLYVCADLNNGAKLIPRSTSIGTWEKFKLVTQGDGTTALLAMANNQYVTCDLNNGAVLVASRAAVGGAWETFYITPQGNTDAWSSIQTMSNNDYVSATNAGSGPLVGNRTTIGNWEKYQIISNSDGTISFLSKINNMYVCADLNQGAELIARSTSIGAWEKFRPVPLGNGQVALLAMANNEYVSCDLNNGDVLYASKPSVGGAWEAFVISDAP